MRAEGNSLRSLRRRNSRNWSHLIELSRPRRKQARVKAKKMSRKLQRVNTVKLRMMAALTAPSLAPSCTSWL